MSSPAIAAALKAEYERGCHDERGRSERKPLTDEQISALYVAADRYTAEGELGTDWRKFARAIERAHGIGDE